MDVYSYGNGEGIDPSAMGGEPQSLEQLLSTSDPFRRQQTYQQQYRPNGPNEHMRRASMMEFGTTDFADRDFQFDPNPVQMPSQLQQMAPPPKALDPRKVRSREDLVLNTQFSHMNAGEYMGDVSYSPAMMTRPAVVEPARYGNMDAVMEFGSMSHDVAPAHMSTNTMQPPMFTTSPMAQSFPMSYPPLSHDPGGGASPQNPLHQVKSHSQGSINQNSMQKNAQPRRGLAAPSPLSMAQSTAASPLPTGAVPQTTSRRHSLDAHSPFPKNANLTTMGQIQQGQMNSLAHGNPVYNRFENAYSSSGFDMLGVLMRVATRRNPEINIGPVDLSCAFVVCDIDQHDLPIVYCSDMFERLTGYTRYEILGRNCRFLQAPDGKVQSGIKRKYVDDKSVLYLKNQISKRAEGQLSIINYRKGGQPFMNLLTMIPITWDTEELRYFVGFQVDLVEQPNSVSGKNPDGTYSINYNRSAMPAYSLPPPPDPTAGLQEGGQTVPRDEVSQVLATIGSGESELSKRIFDKVMLENTDDVVHVLSLKGLFLYLSPASRRVLEYDASELVGTPLSSVCHPSDIVPVTRELKDSSSGAAVNVVYRIRRKKSGYTWFEAHGCLHTEQGKGRKCIILVGRQRPVYALSTNDLNMDGALGDSELWSKLSTSGMFLYVSSSARHMLDRLPEDLVGTSMHVLMRSDTRKEFLQCLETARTGEKVTLNHDLQNRRGQVLQAHTTIYPGDARKGLKPTFFLSQTRLLKMTKATLLTHKSSTGSSMSPVADGVSSTGTPLAQSLQQSPGPNATQARAITGPIVTSAGSNALPLGSQDEALASEDNIFDELKTTRSSSWQYELRSLQRTSRLLNEELQGLLSRKKKRKRRKGLGQLEKDCANCHTRVTPEWRRGPSGQRDLCNSCGLRWAKQVS